MPADFDIELVGADEITRQPQGQRDEGAEREEVIQREAPDLEVLQRLEFEPGAARAVALGPTLFLDRVFFTDEPEHDRHDGNRGRPNLRRRLPAIGDQHEGRAELGHRRADIAGAKYAERGTLLCCGIKPRHIGDTDRKGAAGDADAERGEQKLPISVGVNQPEGRGRRCQHHHRKDTAAANLVGPDAEEDADQGAGENRRADQKAELGLIQPELLLNLNADDGEDGPNRETDGKGDGRNPKRAGASGSPGSCFRLHNQCPNSVKTGIPRPYRTSKSHPILCD